MTWLLTSYLCIAWLIGFTFGSWMQYNRGVAYGATRTIELIEERYTLTPKGDDE